MSETVAQTVASSRSSPTLWARLSERRTLLSSRWFLILIVFMLLFAVGLDLFARSPFEINWDLTEYLAVANNVASGRGFVAFDGTPQIDRPALTLLLAALLKSSGGSMVVIAWAVFTGYALLGSLIFLLGERLYDWRVGLFASVLFICSDSLLARHAQLIDPIWPALVIAAVLTSVCDTAYNRAAGISAALLLSLAWLVKIFAILAFPVPLLAILTSHSRGRITRCFAYCISFLMILISWALIRHIWLDAPAHVLSLEERLYAVAFDELMKGHWVSDSDVVRLVTLRNAPAMPDVTLAGLATLVKFFGYGLWMYVVGPDGLIKNLTAPVLCFTATAFIFVRAILKKAQSDVVVAGLLTVFLPFIAVAGAMEYRYSQALVVIGCVYLCASAAAVALLDKLGKRVWVSAIVIGVISTAVILRTSAEWRHRSVFFPTGTEPLQIKTFHVFDDLGNEFSSLVSGSTIRFATNNYLLGHFLSIKYGSKFILERMPLDYRDAGDWLSTHAPDRIAIATAQGVSAYPRAQFASIPGFRSVNIIDKTGYGFLFFERKPADDHN